MRVSWTWLGEYVDLEGLTPKKVGKKLTMLGLELDAIHESSGGLDRIVAARIETVREHPNADRLKLCDVDAGAHGTSTVVCGAPNAAQGMVAPLALEGAVLPNGMEVRAVTIRGEESRGMLCSERELGVGSSHEGLLRLGDDAEPGQDIVEVLQAQRPDALRRLHRTVLELSITPNRGDCLSHVGVAREIAAAYGRALEIPQPPAPQDTAPSERDVEIENADDCPRYALTLLRNVKVGPSPAWLRRAVEAAGARSINNVVDVTNFVAFELGHPQHAFDAAKLQGTSIEIRRAREGEALEAIDHQHYALEPEDLVIADSEGPVAIAGVMGGAETEVGEKSVDIALECATFDASVVRRTAKRLGLHSESSHRFERGVDANGVDRATRRAIELILRTQSDPDTVEIVETVDAHPAPRELGGIQLRVDRINSLLGTDLAQATVESLLEPLGIECSGADGTLIATPPTTRFDLEREVDLIEEVARRYGLEHIEAAKPVGDLGYVHRRRESPVENMPAVGETVVGWRRLNAEGSLRKRIRDAGFHESVHYAFIDPDDHNALGFDEEDVRRTPVELVNPMSVEQSVMRASLLPGLLRAVGRNQAQQSDGVALYEMASVFWRRGSDSLEDDSGVEEPLMLAAVLWGQRAGHWSVREARDWDVYDLTGLVEVISDELGILLELGSCEAEVGPHLHPGVRAAIRHEGRSIGAVGEAHPRVVEVYDLDGPVYALEIRVDGLFGAAREAVRCQPVPQLPGSRRDLALLVDADLPFAEIGATIEARRPDILESWRLFDVYEGEGIDAGARSIALAFVYRDPSAHDTERGRTLTDDEVTAAHDALVEVLLDELDATQR